MKVIFSAITIVWLFNNTVFCSISKLADDQTVLLWQIGKSDNDNSEFQFAPDEFYLYRNPGIYQLTFI